LNNSLRKNRASPIKADTRFIFLDQNRWFQNQLRGSMNVSPVFIALIFNQVP
jgi:hypothetical protein